MIQVQLDDVLMMNSSEMYVTVYYSTHFPQNYASAASMVSFLAI